MCGRTVVRSKRGAYFFLIDVFIGVFIFIITLFLVNSFQVPKSTLGGAQDQLDLLADDLFTIQVVEFGSIIQDTVHPNYTTDLTLTVDQLVYILYTDNQTQQARNLVGNLSTWLPSHFGFEYSVNGSVIYGRNTITGVMQNQSDVRLTRKKITALEPTLNTSYPFTVSEVVLWR